MSFGSDTYGVEQVCVACGSPTKSHAVPNGYLCHSCLREHDEDTLFDSLPTDPLPKLSAETTVACHYCGTTHTIREVHIPGTETVRVGRGFPVFDTLTSMLWVSCPSCAKATEYLTSAEGAETLADTLGIDIAEYSRREGWLV